MESSKKLSFSPPLICRICGDIARGMNFNVITCVSCKAFFRRNALLLNTHRCQQKNYCNITAEKRSKCSACRLKKCYAYGMDPRLIRSAPLCATDCNMFEQLIMTKQKQLQLPTVEIF